MGFNKQTKTQIQVSAPAKSGYLKTFDSLDEALTTLAELCHCHEDDLIMLDSPDGSVTYCYGSQDEADLDATGAYAVQYRETV